MARKLNAYQRLVKEVQDALPDNAPPSARGAATRKAAELWKNGKRGERNPRGDSSRLLKLALVAGAAIVLLPRIMGQRGQG